MQAGETSIGLSIARDGSFRMLAEPLAFRDPVHFRSFARSRLFRVMAAGQAKRDGIFPVAAAYAGQQALLSKKPIASLEDFKGMRVRSFSKTLFPALGAKAVSLPLAEVKPALDRSVVDAAETLPTLISSLKWPEAARNLYLTGFVTETVLFSVQSKAWSALPPETRKEVGMWISKAAEACSRANYDAESRALKELESKGVRVFPFDAAKVRARLPAPKGGPGWTAGTWNELQALK
ncbi:MAG: TRAP transporter substrate-binding protein DctP [Candidatus Tectomicrobia bacterium]|uniref:TRAP transporter substrate-binding protein DctP n=1 Tax=Tectimicrobiota bacterium TaxID=2528274 RepID=A0A932HWU6_UNCTE|nr:TRAP transporter substrate-binding protein DctP [Candidatus Tectomicrobia bacterium]